MEIHSSLRICFRKWSFSGQHFERCNTQRVNICTLAHGLTFDLLRHHINHSTKGSKILNSNHTRGGKIKNLKSIVLLHQNVEGVIISMNDTLF